MEYRKQGHCVYYAKYHLVFVTKYRRHIFNPGIMAYLRQIILRVKDHYPEIDIEQIEGSLDHIHLFVSIPPKMSVSKVVNIIKSNTGKALRDKFKFLDVFYFNHQGIWSNGYFVSTAGINELIIKRYINLQGKEDKGQAKLEIS